MLRRTRKTDPSVKAGIAKGLRDAIPLEDPIDPTLNNLVDKLNGIYLPDNVSDKRVEQLIERLNGLPWPKE